MNSETLALAGKLAKLLKAGKIYSSSAEPLAAGDQGFSGAAVHRLRVIFEDGRPGSFICKQASLKERMVMKTLTDQGHRHTPAAYSADCSTDAPAWMVQQDLGRRAGAPQADRQWMERVAKALADIHVANMNRGEGMPWLPHADAAYWTRIVTQISVDHFERAIEESQAFARQFGQLLPRLRRAGARFASDMTALCAEAQWLTLTHGDLQSIDGDHVYNVNGVPYFIDFGFSCYAPFYIDLAPYFSFDDASLYHQALLEKGLSLKPTDFEERFRAAHRYTGFIYMFPSILQWQRGSEQRLMGLLDTILA